MAAHEVHLGPGAKLTRVYRFFNEHPFFTTAEFANAYCADGSSYAAACSALHYYHRNRHLMPLRRSLWHVVGGPFEPFELASRLAPDAVFAYDGALTAHGLRGIEYSCTVAAGRWRPSLCFGDTIFRTVKSPLADPMAHTCLVEVEGRRHVVTTVARTLVDCMHRLDLSPGFIGTLLAFAREPDLRLDLDEVLAYARLLGSPVAAARTAACLWGNSSWLGTETTQFALARLGTKQTMYATADRDKSTAYMSRFRLMVPDQFKALKYSRRGPERLDSLVPESEEDDD